jgi:hypothetical protein
MQIERAVGLMAVQKHRHRDDGDMGQHQGHDDIAPREGRKRLKKALRPCLPTVVAAVASISGVTPPRSQAPVLPDHVLGGVGGTRRQGRRLD